MPLSQVWGSLVIFVFCPLLGGLPLIAWLTRAIAGKDLRHLGTGNLSVAAAFYHGGRTAGLLAAGSEAAKGIAAVLLARALFPGEPAWELVALLALVAGRYWMGNGAGTTNAFWGIIAHDPVGAALLVFIGGISFTLVRDRHSSRLLGLGLLVLILSLRHPHDPPTMLAAAALALTIGWIYQKIPDDLDLPETGINPQSQTMFRFFRGDQALLTLNDRLEASKVGNKAATLAQLKRWGYPVPEGWVLPAGDDPRPLALSLQPTADQPLIVRSSASGEDERTASAAGQYESIANITSGADLEAAILRCQTSYTRPAAIAYRRDRQIPEGSLAVLVQRQIRGAISGVAFSRDPLARHSDAVLVEALPGSAERVVSGQVTPQRYRVYFSTDSAAETEEAAPNVIIDGDGDLPTSTIQAAAQLARELEGRFYGVPQDIEWTFDGEQLWLLQARPIANLQPIWTRKIAAEAIPGAIRPLPWSINRPLTCGVWGEIFTLVLDQRARDLDFNKTAALHYARAYFNASLLEQIFRRMGLPPESLEFLTRGAPLSKPPWTATLRNTPGLLRLLQREWQLGRDFRRDWRTLFERSLHQIETQNLEELSTEELFWRVETILSVLRRVTYYNILAPLSFAFRQAVLRVAPDELDTSPLPEVRSLRELAQLAAEARHLLPLAQLGIDSCPSLFACLGELPDGESVLAQFAAWLQRYSYLSEAATDIAAPRWCEDPRPVRELFAQYLLHPPPEPAPPPKSQRWTARQVQKRLDLKGRVAELYARLLAHLRWTLLALAQRWQVSGILAETDDLFFLEFDEVRQLVENATGDLRQQLPDLIAQRRSHFERDRQLASVPNVLYGEPDSTAYLPPPPFPSRQQLRGIPGSPGIATGQVRIATSLSNLEALAAIDKGTILVVPYTDAGWAPLLARAGGLIAEVGGQLSHGAIVAREYRIPAVMDVTEATQRLRDGQYVRLDGQAGQVDILADSPEAPSPSEEPT